MQNLKDINGNTMLHMKITSDTARILIENGADINAINCHNKTPLFYAVINNNFNLVKLLIENGANKNTDVLVNYPTTDEIKMYMIRRGFPATEKDKKLYGNV
jgi:ankyrin repeat protein